MIPRKWSIFKFPEHGATSESFQQSKHCSSPQWFREARTGRIQTRPVYLGQSINHVVGDCSRGQHNCYSTECTCVLNIDLYPSFADVECQAIVQDIGGNSNQAFWIGTSYLVTCAACMPFTSSASDVFGRPRILFLSTFLFTVGTGVCCLSGNIGVLIAGRTIQGIGSGGMYVLTLVIFTDIVPLPQRPRLYGIM